MLYRVDGHAVLVNAAAMRLARLTPDTPDPKGGKIVRDGEGTPTGVLLDAAVDLVRNRIPKLSVGQRRQYIRTSIQECLRNGITTVHDAGVDGETIDLYKTLTDRKQLRMRVYAMVSEKDEETVQRFYKQGPLIGYGDDRLTVRSVKIYADGALGSRGAALLAPYSDDPGNTGLLIVPYDPLKAMTVAALDAGFQVCTHAIGDRANRVTLNAYEAAMRAVPKARKNARLRIEHAQVVAPDDFGRFQSLGVIPSMQPSHAISDMPWAEQRLGPERILGAYAWQKFIKLDIRIAGGSDFPVESMNPLLGFYAAITRQDVNGQPPEGWYPEERMSRDEALACFTINGAYAAFEEDIKGSISSGKWADLTVLSADIMKISPKDILNTDVEMTLVGGQVVYRKPPR
jgi:predicted amidohydrolase YtcJ